MQTIDSAKNIQSYVSKDDSLRKLKRIISDILNPLKLGLNDLEEFHIILSEFRGNIETLDNFVFIRFRGVFDEKLESNLAEDVEFYFKKMFNEGEVIQFMNDVEIADSWGNLALEKIIRQ